MKKLALFTKTNIFLNKFIACLVFFCIIMTSTNIVNNFSEPILIEGSIQISAETILVQFFYISTMPANFISRLFLNRQADPISNTKKSDEKNKNKSESNSAKASVGFSILPAQTDLSKTLELKNLKLGNGILAFLKSLEHYFNFSGFISSFFYCCKFNLKIITMLLLAILITRRNIGEDSIFTINIENNRLARLYF